VSDGAMIPREASDPGGRILVLPFVGGDDGLAELAMSAFAQFAEFTIFRPPATCADIDHPSRAASIGRGLNVPFVVLGSIADHGSRLGIAVAVVDSDGGNNLWSATYDISRARADSLFEELARHVLHILHLVHDLTVDCATKQAAWGPQRHYAVGRYFWNQLWPANQVKAIAHFKKAIHLAPDDPLAYSGLADSLFFVALEKRGTGAAEEAREQAKKALDLDPHLPQALTTLGGLAMLVDRDTPTAVSLLERAIAEDPCYAFAFHLKGVLESSLGCFESAMASFMRAIEIDPLSSVQIRNLGYAKLCAGEPHEALSEFKRALELDPNLFGCRLGIGFALLELHEPSRAIAEFRQESVMPDGHEHIDRLLIGIGYARVGHGGPLRRLLATRQEGAGFLLPTWRGLAAIEAGEPELAYRMFRRAVDHDGAWFNHFVRCPIAQRYHRADWYKEVLHAASLDV
jgi:tetratricopeptide (TPR) repeat protein